MPSLVIEDVLVPFEGGLSGLDGEGLLEPPPHALKLNNATSAQKEIAEIRVEVRFSTAMPSY